MDVTRSTNLRSIARQNLVSCWKLWPDGSILVKDFLLQAPNRLATDILGLRITIAKETSSGVVGQMNRQRKEIHIFSDDDSFERGRFTLAHEIGHYVLHPDLGTVLYRKSSSGLVADCDRKIEREANIFASEILMPSSFVKEQFLARFQDVVDGKRPDQLGFWLSARNGKLDRQALAADDPRYRANALAKARNYYGKPIVSLCELFRVSAEALSIKLIELGLVR